MMVVEPSLAPRGPATRSDAFHRRKDNGSNVIEPSSAPRALDAGAASRSDDCRRRKDKRRQRPAVADSRWSSATAAASSNRLRSPLARYLLLSTVLLAVGLSVRYLWRQLAGLVGAALILSASRRRRDGAGARGKPPDALSSGDVSRPGGGSYQTTDQGRKTSIPPGDGLMGRDSVAAEETLTGESDAREGVDERTLREDSDDAWQGFADAPTELRRFWEDGGPGCQFLVRGPNYMSDRKKILAGPAVMRLAHVDFFAVEREEFHVASKGRCRDRVSAFIRSYEERGETAPFIFILNILVPGDPIVATVMYLVLDQTTLQQQRQQRGGRGGEKEECMAPSAGDRGTSGFDTFLGMLERYAEVPGSGYKKLERTRSPRSPATSTSSSSPLAATAVNSTPSPPPPNASSTPVPSVTPTAPPTPPPPRQQEQQPQPQEVSSSPSSSPESGDLGALAGAWAEAGSQAAISPGGGSDNSGSGPEGVLADRSTDAAGVLPAEDFRNQRFKLIPSVVSGPFIVRKAVGNKPALLGRKLTQRYFRGPGYVETDVDVGSSMIAEKIVSLCRGYAKALTVELGICLEGRCDEELPEKVMGVIRLVNLDVDIAERLEDPASPASSEEEHFSTTTGDPPSSGGGTEGETGRPMKTPRVGHEHPDRNR